MTLRVIFLLVTASAIYARAAEMWPLEKLYARPYVWGTKPQELTWSKRGNMLGFLWNAQGGRFLDLYVYDAGASKLARITDLESWEDELLRSADDKDARKSRYKAPASGLSSFVLSADGKQAAFSYKGELFVGPTDGSQSPIRLTRTKASETAPQFSPAGTKLASIRGGQVVIQNFAGGQLWQVTDVEAPDTLSEYWWSPDGEWIVYSIRKQGGRTMPLPNYSGRFVESRSFSRTVAGDDPVSPALFAMKASGTSKPIPLDLGKWGTKAHTSDPVWSPDSKRVALRTVSANHKEQQLLVIDPATGKSRGVAEDKDDAWVFWSEFEWSPDAKWLWFNSERDGFAHIYKVAADAPPASAPVQLTKGKWEAREERQLTHQPQWAGDWIWFSSTEAGARQRQVYRIRADGSGKERVSTMAGVDDVLVSDDGAQVALLHADLNSPFDLWVNGRRVTTSARPEFQQLPWPATSFVEFPSRGDRQAVAAKLLLPPGYDPARRDGKQWPCVFFIHGAGYATSVLEQWGSYNELRYVYNAYLASRGYVVMDLDYRGSSGYGRDWRAGIYLHMGGKDLDDVLGGVDYLAGLGNVDMKRLGMWGVSYGGFMTNMAMFLAPGVFRAGSSWAAVNDWENYNAGYSAQRLNTPRSNPEAYRRSSPIHFSGNLQDKLLIIHGMVDSNVLFQDAVQLTEKLIQEGKDFSHFYYPEEDHGFVRDETWIDALRRTTEWFDRHLAAR